MENLFYLYAILLITLGIISVLQLFSQCFDKPSLLKYFLTASILFFIQMINTNYNTLSILLFIFLCYIIYDILLEFLLPKLGGINIMLRLIIIIFIPFLYTSFINIFIIQVPREFLLALFICPFFYLLYILIISGNKQLKSNSAYIVIPLLFKIYYIGINNYALNKRKDIINIPGNEELNHCYSMIQLVKLYRKIKPGNYYLIDTNYNVFNWLREKKGIDIISYNVELIKKFAKYQNIKTEKLFFGDNLDDQYKILYPDKIYTVIFKRIK